MSDLIKLQRSASNKSLLYIDSDMAMQKNYGIYFQKSFENFYQAYEGEEGFELYKKHKPDVVLLNLELENKDAIDLISDIHDIDEDVILISISEECENYDLLQTLDMGLDKMLLKPIGFAKIAHTLLSLLPPPPPVKPKEKIVQKPIVKKEPIKELEPQKPQEKKVQEIKTEPVKKTLPKETVKPKPKPPEKVVEKPAIKSEAEVCFELIKELSNKKTLVEFINSYKGIMILHDGVIGEVQKESFIIKVNIAQILAAKSEKQVLIKTPDHKYINASLKGIDLKNSLLQLTSPRILKYKQRDKEYARILADRSFKASIYVRKKHIDFEVTYISFRSAVLICDNPEINLNVGDVTDITLGFNISGPNAMIRDKKFTKIFAKCEVIRIDEKKGLKQIVVLLEVNKAGERTLKKYLSERESELIYEFKSRVRR